MSPDYWSTPDPYVILCFLAIPLTLLGVMIAVAIRDRKRRARKPSNSSDD